MQTITTYVGIDISKSYFDVAIPNNKGYSHHKFDNNQTGFLALLNVLPTESNVVMEASGPYYVRIANFLATNSIPVSVVNPLVIRRFCQMRMSRAKTDKKDSKMIAEYGCMENPPLWQPPKEHEIALQQMQTLLANVQKEYQAANNQLGILYPNGYA